MRRPSTLVVPLAMLLVSMSALLMACTDLQGGADATDDTAITAAVAVEDTMTQSTAGTESTVAVATTNTAPSAPPPNPAEPTTTTALIQIVPGLIHTEASLLKVDPNLLTAPTRCEDINPALHYKGLWHTHLESDSSVECSGDTFRASHTEGSYVELVFEGTGARLIAMKGQQGGKLRIVLTGNGISRVETVSLYSATPIFEQTVWYSGPLANADYALYIEHDTANTGFKAVWVDAIDIWGIITPW